MCRENVLLAKSGNGFIGKLADFGMTYSDDTALEVAAGSVSAATITKVTSDGLLVVSRSVHVDKAVTMLILEVRHPDVGVDNVFGEGSVLIGGRPALFLGAATLAK